MVCEGTEFGSENCVNVLYNVFSLPGLSVGVAHCHKIHRFLAISQVFQEPNKFFLIVD